MIFTSLMALAWYHLLVGWCQYSTTMLALRSHTCTAAVMLHCLMCHTCYRYGQGLICYVCNIINIYCFTWKINLGGVKVIDLIKAAFVADVDALKEQHSVYTLMTNDDGGIIDDAILTCTGENSYYLVSNASRADEVIKRLKVSHHHLYVTLCVWLWWQQIHQEKQIEADINVLEDNSLLALQGVKCLSSMCINHVHCTGPAMVNVLSQGISHDLRELRFMTSGVMEVFGIGQCRVSRCGYTGEDGVEVSQSIYHCPY